MSTLHVTHFELTLHMKVLYMNAINDLNDINTIILCSNNTAIVNCWLLDTVYSDMIHRNLKTN